MSKQISVSIVRDDGYALSVGIKPKDLIYRINGQPVSSCQQVTDLIRDGRVTFTIVRGNSVFDVEIKSPTLGVVLDEIEFDEEGWMLGIAVESIVLSTAQSIPGKDISRTIGIIGAQCVLGLNAISDLMAGIRDMVGGRSATLQSALVQARSIVSSELKAEAHKIGANGVIAVSFSYSDIGDKGGYMLMVTATGTAVLTS